MKALLAAAALTLAAAGASAQQDFSKVEVKAIKITNNIYMLTGAGGNLGVSAGEDTVFVIDYRQLAQLPDVGAPQAPASGKRPSDSNVPPDAKEQDIKQIREDMKKKDVEIENLKKEMEDIRRDIGKPSGKAP